MAPWCERMQWNWSFYPQGQLWPKAFSDSFRFVGLSLSGQFSIVNFLKFRVFSWFWILNTIHHWQVLNRKTGEMEDRQCVWIQVELTREKYEEESTSRAMRLSQQSTNPTEVQVKEAQLKVASFDTCLCINQFFCLPIEVAKMLYMSPDSRLWEIGRWRLFFFLIVLLNMGEGMRSN